MMAGLWSDIADDIASAKRHFAQASRLYRSGTVDGGDYVSVMAFQHAMQAGYTSFEAGMRRLLHSIDEALPAGQDSHAALTRRLGRVMPGSRPAILERPLLTHVDELRRFRHVAMHAYDDFTPRKAAIPVEAAEAFVAGIDDALVRVRAALDPAP